MLAGATRIGLWRPQVGLEESRGEHVHFAMQIADDDFDARVEAIRAHGHEVPVHEFGASRTARRRRARRTSDPDGHLVELWTADMRDYEGSRRVRLTEGRTSAQGRAASIWAASESVASSSGAAISWTAIGIGAVEPGGDGCGRLAGEVPHRGEQAVPDRPVERHQRAAPLPFPDRWCGTRGRGREQHVEVAEQRVDARHDFRLSRTAASHRACGDERAEAARPDACGLRAARVRQGVVADAAGSGA